MHVYLKVRQSIQKLAKLPGNYWVLEKYLESTGKVLGGKLEMYWYSTLKVQGKY